MLPDFTAVQWLLAALAGVGIGVSKSGLPGISLLHVVIFAQLFPGLASTGVVLPMLVCGDIGAVLLFRRDARWPHIARRLPHSTAFAWTMGLVAGVTTMLANAAGPVMGLYLLAVALPKEAFVGTAAWFFLLINLIKVPFSAQLGLITFPSLAFNAALVPFIASGLFLGRAVVSRLPQRWFDTLILAFAGVAAMRLLGVF